MFQLQIAAVLDQRTVVYWGTHISYCVVRYIRFYSMYVCAVQGKVLYCTVLGRKSATVVPGNLTMLHPYQVNDG